MQILERETRFEPATFTLARWRSTTELFPHNHPHCFCWWKLQGSNLWPSACKADALPAELSFRRKLIYYTTSKKERQAFFNTFLKKIKKIFANNFWRGYALLEYAIFPILCEKLCLKGTKSVYIWYKAGRSRWQNARTRVIIRKNKRKRYFYEICA